MPNGRVEAIAYAEGQRAITSQRASLDELRSRAGVVLSAAAISGSFLGSQALDASDFGPLSGVALAGFLLTLVATLVIFWPQRKGWIFVFDPNIILADWKDRGGRSVEGFLAGTLSEHYGKNEKRLARLFYWFEAACAGLAMQVAFWIVQLATA